MSLNLIGYAEEEWRTLPPSSVRANHPIYVPGRNGNIRKLPPTEPPQCGWAFPLFNRSPAGALGLGACLFEHSPGKHSHRGRKGSAPIPGRRTVQKSRGYQNTAAASLSSVSAAGDSRTPFRHRPPATTQRKDALTQTSLNLPRSRCHQTFRALCRCRTVLLR